MGWSDDYLEHHGILGQKWGVRRFQNPDGTLKPAGRKRYDEDSDYKKTSKSSTPKSSSSEEMPKKTGLTDKQKKVIIAGAAVVGTALAAYGGYKLYQAMDKKATEGLSQKYKAESIKLTDKKYDAINMMTKWQGNASNYANERNDSSHSSAVRDYAEKARQESLNMAGKAFKDYKDLSAKKGVIDTVAKEKAFSKGEKADFLKEKAAEKINSTVKREVIKPNTKDWVADRIKDVRSTDNSKMPIYYTEAFSSGRKALSKPVQNSTPVNRTSVNKTPIKGSKTFIDASKANDDLVQELLKKNTLRF